MYRNFDVKRFEKYYFSYRTSHIVFILKQDICDDPHGKKIMRQYVEVKFIYEYTWTLTSTSLRCLFRMGSSLEIYEVLFH